MHKKGADVMIAVALMVLVLAVFFIAVLPAIFASRMK